ncbi:hypothetical protein BH23GEM9_BH23GEM9_36930 [soil metagenome]
MSTHRADFGITAFLAVLATGLAGMEGTSLTGPEGTACRPVHGTIDGRVTRVRPGMTGLRLSGHGRSAGDLAGNVSLSAVKNLIGDQLSVRIEISTDTTAFLVSGKATALEDSLHHELRSVRGALTFSRHSAELPASGTLLVNGTANTRTRDAHLEYAGEFCTRTVAVDTNATRTRRGIGKRLAAAK